jgi:hypothetical protein
MVIIEVHFDPEAEGSVCFPNIGITYKIARRNNTEVCNVNIQRR